jgi:hypothetical protein
MFDGTSPKTPLYNVTIRGINNLYLPAASNTESKETGPAIIVAVPSAITHPNFAQYNAQAICEAY